MATFTLRSFEFRREREASWSELELLCSKVERKGMRSLNADELYRLPTLYRGALSSLSIARAISLDKNVVNYLESLSARAYVSVYGTRKPFRDTLTAFFTTRFPALVRARWRAVLVAFAFLGLGIATGYFMTRADPERYYSFVGREMASGRSPASSREELLRVLNDSGGGAAEALTRFATFLFTNNAKIGLLCFALGFVAGVPVMYLLFVNGLDLGAMAAIYAQKGLSLEFWLWILPHGVTELLALALCAAAGLTIGQRLVFPGKHRRVDELAAGGREAGAIAVGAVALFFVAALIEGFFRQMVHDPVPRALVAAGTTVFWIVYFVRKPRRVR